MPQHFLKDPAAVLDYQIDWSDWLDTDTIQTSTWAAATGLTVDSDALTATTTTVWLAGGTAGQSYEITNHIVTVAGREDERTLLIMIAEQ